MGNGKPGMKYLLLIALKSYNLAGILQANIDYNLTSVSFHTTAPLSWSQSLVLHLLFRIEISMLA